MSVKYIDKFRIVDDNGNPIDNEDTVLQIAEKNIIFRTDDGGIIPRIGSLESTTKTQGETLDDLKIRVGTCEEDIKGHNTRIETNKTNISSLNTLIQDLQKDLETVEEDLSAYYKKEGDSLTTLTVTNSIITPKITAETGKVLQLGSCQTDSITIGKYTFKKEDNALWTLPAIKCSGLTCTEDINATDKTITAGTVKASTIQVDTVKTTNSKDTITIPVANILTSTNFNTQVTSLTPTSLTVNGMGVLKYKLMQTGTLIAKNGTAGEVLMFYHDETVREASYPFGCILKTKNSFYVSPIIPFVQNISITVQINDNFYKLSPCQDGEQVEITIPFGSTLFYKNQQIDLYFIYL